MLKICTNCIYSKVYADFDGMNVVCCHPKGRGNSASSLRGSFHSTHDREMFMRDFPELCERVAIWYEPKTSENE